MADLPWTSGKVASGREEIYYERTGEGNDVVVLCHGLGGNHAVWYQQVPVLAGWCQVVTWDQRGFGLSSNRGAESGPAAAVHDLQALLDHLDVEHAHLVGQSMGGWCVLGFALRSPHRVRSLVIADSTAGVVNDEINDALVTIKRREIPPGTAGAHAAIGERLRQQDPAKAFLYQEIGSFRGNVEDVDMIGKLFTTRYQLADVATLGIPTLFIVGSDDDLIPPRALREVAALMGARLIEIEGAGHSPYFEQPDAWNTAVLEFLEGLT